MTAKWRTKTGCLTCRKRRKKCDERAKGKGSCTACSRNGLSCVWPGQEQKLHSRQKRDDSTVKTQPLEVIEIRSSPDSTESPESIDSTEIHDLQALELYNSESDDICPSSPSICAENLGWLMRNSPFHPSLWLGSPVRHKLFKYYASTLCAVLIRMDSHPGFCDWTYTIACALEHRPLMDAVIACAAVHASRTSPEMLQIAYTYYSSAVSKTRALIAANQLDAEEDWLLMMVCHLAIFERNQPQSFSRASTHLQGAVYLMSLRRAKVSKDALPLVTIKPHQRLYAESVIYNTSFTAFLSPDISWLSDSNVWDQVEVFCTANPYPGHPESSISPLVGVPVKICYLILEVSRLARSLPWSELDCKKATTVRMELDAWLANTDCESFSTMGGLSWCSAKLFLFAVDILLLKATETSITSSDPRVRKRVDQSLDLLRGEDEDGLYWNQHFCWPIAILACTVDNAADFIFLQYKLEKQWERSFFGDVKRTGAILEAMWKRFPWTWDKDSRMESKDTDIVKRCDMIDLLLRRGGLSSILNE